MFCTLNGTHRSMVQRRLKAGARGLIFCLAGGFSLLGSAHAEELTPVAPPAAVPAASPAPEPPVVRTRYELDRMENGVLHLHAPTGKMRPPPLKSHLFEPEFVGLLHPQGDAMAYVLMTGLACAGCTDQKLVFMARADGQDPHVLTYPGRIRDRKNNQLVHESQGYFGQCVAGRGEGYFLFQKEKVDRRRHLQESVFAVHIDGTGRLHEKLETARRLPKVQKANLKKSCFQLPGYERSTLAFKIPHLKGGDEREKLEEEKEKELEQAPEGEREDDPAATLVPE